MERPTHPKTVGQMEKPIIHHNTCNWGEAWKFVYDGGNTVCGLDWWTGENNTILHGLSTVPNERHKGNATQLLGFVVNYSREVIGVKQVLLSVENDKKQLIEFYLLRGWHIFKDCEGNEILDDEGYAWLEAD